MDDDLELRVVEVRRESEGVVSLTFESADGASLPPWEAGAHLSLDLPVGRRQYSLCGEPEGLTYTIAVLESPTSRGGSVHVHRDLVVGSVVRSRLPKNNFRLVDAESYLFIAGGIGITPILPMLREAEAKRRPWKLVYGGRNRESMAFLTELSKHGDLVDVVPQDTRGLIDLDALLFNGLPAAVYSCGPEPLLRAVEDHPALAGTGVVHLERFSASEDAAISSEADSEFEVICASSGLAVPVPVGTTMLSALLEAGFDIESDCEEGVCGTCELGLIAGSPDHRDDILAEGEKAMLVIPCVSRALSKALTVDL
jgi:ferredoxin-NADP reductase